MQKALQLVLQAVDGVILLLKLLEKFVTLGAKQCEFLLELDRTCRSLRAHVMYIHHNEA